MLDNTPTNDICKWTVTTLQSVFEEAVVLFEEEYSLEKSKFDRSDFRISRNPLPPVYVDCGNTLFDKSVNTPTIKPDFLNFLIALKNGGYDVQLMSHEPLKYLDALHAELRIRGLSERFFEDEHSLTILRKEIANDNTKGLILIDNDIFSISMLIKRRIFPDDEGFVRELKAYADFKTAVLPDEMRADVLWAKATARHMPLALQTLSP